MRKFDALTADLKRLSEQKTPLRVAFSESLLPFILPDLELTLKEFQANYPHIPLLARNLPADDVINALHAREIDCGILLQMPTPYPNCEVEVLHAFPVAVDSGESSPLFRKKSLSLPDLASVPLIGMGRLDKIARPLWEDCRREGLTLDYRIMPNTVDAFYHIQHSLTSGFDIYFEDDSVPAGCSLLPGYTWELAMILPTESPAFGPARLLCHALKERYQERLKNPF